MKYFISVLLILMVFLAAEAQSKLDIGLKSGLNTSWSGFNEAENTAGIQLMNSHNPLVALVLGIHINEETALRTGFAWLQKGIKAKVYENNREVSLQKLYSVIEIPVSFNLKWPISKSVFLRQETGISIDIYEGAGSGEASYPISSQPVLEFRDMPDRLVSSNLFAGLALDIHTGGALYLSLGANYHHGLDRSFLRGELIYNTRDRSYVNEVLIDGSYFEAYASLHIPASNIASLFRALF